MLLLVELCHKIMYDRVRELLNSLFFNGDVYGKKT